MSQRHADHAHDHTNVPSEPALRVKALESLLVDKGLVDPAALDVLVDTYENKVGPRHGAQVVARAWVDPAYKQRLLADGTAAIAELGFSGGQGEKLTVVENTPAVVQVLRLSLTDGDGPTGRAAQTGAGPPRRDRSPGLGQQCGLALSGPARAPSRHSIPERSRPGQVSHARCDDRRRDSPLSP